MSEVSNPLARLEAAHRMLAEARTVDEVKEVRDKAEVARLYARERDLGLESQNWAAEIKIRAERKLGELLAEMPKHPGAATPSQVATALPPRLADLGVSRTESSRWQRIATIPEPEFERHIATAKAEERELTTDSVVKLAKKRQQAEDADTADRVFEAAFAISPGAEDRIKQSKLRVSFARALANAGALICLEPGALAAAFEQEQVRDAQRFISQFRAWADALELELARPLRAVK